MQRLKWIIKVLVVIHFLDFMLNQLFVMVLWIMIWTLLQNQFW